MTLKTTRIILHCAIIQIVGSMYVVSATSKEKLNAELAAWVQTNWKKLGPKYRMPLTPALAVDEFFKYFPADETPPLTFEESSVEMPDFEDLLNRVYGAMENVGFSVADQLEAMRGRWEADTPTEQEWEKDAEDIDYLMKDLGGLLKKEYVPILSEEGGESK